MKFRVVTTVGVVVLLVAILTASLGALTTVLGHAAMDTLSERLETDAKVFLETWAYRQRVQSSEVRVAAAEPRLKAVVGSSDIGQETIDGVAVEMRDALGSDVFVLLDEQGHVIVDANHADAVGADMSQQPLIKTASASGSASGVWVEQDKVYQVQAAQLAFGRRGIGVLATGKLVDSELASAVNRQTGAGVVLELNGRVLARSSEFDGQQLDDAQLTPVLQTLSGGDSLVELAGKQFLVRTDVLPDYSGKHKLRFAIVRSLDRALEPATRLERVLFGILGLALIVGVLFALWLSRMLSRPLERLAALVGKLGGGQLSLRAKAEGPSEVRQLAGAINSMATELEASRDQLAEKQRLEREMEIAESIQTSILPRTLSVPGFEIVATMLPADEVGGDYYDVIPAEEGCWIGIGDVAGHGLPAGMIMLMIQSCVSSLVRARPDADPSELVETLNRVIYENIRQRLVATEHVTFCLLRVFPDGRVRFSGAHEEILILRKATNEVERIQTTGIWLGGRVDIEDFTTDAEFQLHPGDRVLLYTDGIIEAHDEDREEFGVDRLVAGLMSRSSQSLAQVRDGLLAQGRSWSPVQVDDISLLLFEYNP